MSELLIDTILSHMSYGAILDPITDILISMRRREEKAYETLSFV